ncbi:site-specific integrase [Labrenzia aggregata]|uniref:Site-specific integrase n=2 Tax=Roseibium aggregatum TaxID=187304 RepID=A0A926P6S9_9HYPH|nr:site-specific integrase [Roseibium aggregatum]
MAWITERKKKDGSTQYKAVVRIKGYPSRSATFPRKTDAVLWAKQIEVSMLEGRHFKDAENKRRTFGDMIDRYIDAVVPVRHNKPLARNAILCHLRWWKSELGDLLLTEVNAPKIVEKRDTLLNAPALDSNGRPLLDEEGNQRRAKSPATVVRYLASLSVVYTTAVNEWEWIDQNPVKKVRRPKEPSGRVRFLSDAERENLLEACQKSKNRYLYPIVVLALSTGARHNEIRSLTWLQVDLERCVIRLLETKNNERRSLPLTGLALELVTQLSQSRPDGTDLVFPRPDGKKPVFIENDWKNALADAEIKDFRFHDLRHSAASYLAMNGATLAEIADVLGHKTLQMVKRYAHMSEQHTMGVVERMNQKIFAPADNDNEPLKHPRNKKRL